ncbi:class I SAM-dependent methyltransferase [Verrucomicrobiota bacterium]
MGTDGIDEIFSNYWRIKQFGAEIRHPIPVIVSSGDPRMEAEDVHSPQISLYFSGLPSGGSMLDVGAGDKYIEVALKKRGVDAEYFSLDTAQRENVRYDFASLDEIQTQFDLIVMQEVIEHLPLALGYSYLKRAHALLKPGGELVVTLPNIRHPIQFHKADFSHVQHYPLGDLYGILRVVGFSDEVEFRMIEICPRGLSLRQRVRRHIQKFLFRLLDFSFQHAVLIKVRKAKPSGS